MGGQQQIGGGAPVRPKHSKGIFQAAGNLYSESPTPKRGKESIRKNSDHSFSIFLEIEGDQGTSPFHPVPV